MSAAEDPSQRLPEVLEDMGPRGLAIAVSGGVDSLTLATVAARHVRCATMFHAVSPAVPPEATRRVETLARVQGWNLEVIDAGEFSRDEYLANPVNRCYFCKESLYAAIARHAGTGVQLASGTNVDDLGEYRPGLDAARLAGVRHPFVEAGMRKGDVRALAASLGLGAVAELPASPCLASRVETNIPVTPELLQLVDRTEGVLRDLLDAKTVRCRYRGAGVVLELEEADLRSLQANPNSKARALEEVRRIFAGSVYDAPVSLAAYRRGSAFLLHHAPRHPA